MTHAVRLLDEPPISLYPSLAKALGVNKALIVQQLHFLLNSAKTARNEYVHVKGRWWVYNSYPEWRERYFVWLSEAAIKHLFQELEGQGLVLSMQSVKSPLDRRKWYTIDYETWAKQMASMGQNLSDGTDKNDPLNGQNLSHDLSETPTETPSENEDSAADAAPTGFASDSAQEVGATPSVEASTKPVQAHIALVDAYHSALPDDVRPPDPNYSRNASAARKLRDEGITSDQVVAFVSETYPTYRKWARKQGAPELMSLDHVVTYIKAFLTRSNKNATNQPDNGQATAAAVERQRQLAERFNLND